ncbi:MAG: hypothetical protein ACXW02_06310, partial [Halobacteriota archaeon]
KASIEPGNRLISARSYDSKALVFTTASKAKASLRHHLKQIVLALIFYYFSHYSKEAGYLNLM